MAGVTVPTTAELGDTVSLGANASGAITEFRWDFDGDGITDATTTGSNATHVYDESGTFTPTVTAMDDDGASASTHATISVSDTRAPVADLSGPTTTAVGVPATFDAGGTTDAGGVVRYVWEFEDGTTVETETSTVSHAFESVGSHTVRVIAFDGAGNADAVTMDVSVTETPAIWAGSDRWFVNESEATLSYAVANADGATAEYAIDGGAWRPASSPLSVTGLDSGNHSVAFRLVNESGPLPHESASDVATLTVDTDPPELAVEATRADVRPGTPLRVTVTDTAISDVFYRTNRSESGRLDFADVRGSATVALDTSRWAGRPTELVVTARDRAGNVRRERVGFDFTPDLEIESFRPANGTQVSNVVVSATFARGTASLFVNGERVSEEVSGTSLEAPLSDLAPAITRHVSWSPPRATRFPRPGRSKSSQVTETTERAAAVAVAAVAD
ncbi:PKD domain-containing protein [Haladaptatus sp. NG-WS-4]